jgi:hypothetical protein
VAGNWGANRSVRSKLTPFPFLDRHRSQRLRRGGPQNSQDIFHHSYLISKVFQEEFSAIPEQEREMNNPGMIGGPWKSSG